MLCSVVRCYQQSLHAVQYCYMLPRFITCCAVLLRVISGYYMMCSVVPCGKGYYMLCNVVTRGIVLLNFVQQCYML